MTNKITTFLQESRVELKKVTWPTKEQTIQYTMAVVVVSLGIAAFLGALDYLFQIIINRVIV